jgi:hypothetical protein
VLIYVIGTVSYCQELPSLVLERLAIPGDFVRIVTQAKYWLRQCADHSACRRGDSHFRPTRLLYVDSGDPSIVRMVTKSEMPINLRYVTLSHCWGQSQPYELLRTNYNNFKTNVSYHKLPKTFRDAILVTWGLNISYLWIDSLCIIQDSLND